MFEYRIEWQFQASSTGGEWGIGPWKEYRLLRNITLEQAKLELERTQNSFVDCCHDYFRLSRRKITEFEVIKTNQSKIKGEWDNDIGPMPPSYIGG